MRTPASRTSRTLLGAVLTLASGCVTRVEGPGGSVRDGGRTASTGLRRATQDPPPIVVELPEGPIATPVDDPAASASSSVVVEVAPLGSVPYDGQVLPLVSPDGRYLACQVGSAPAWSVLLGGTSPYPLATRIEVFDLSRSPIERVYPDDPLPAGLVLGRSCDAAGFLVEGCRVDGQRWIGRVSWAGRLEWLVKGGGAPAAHAFVSAQGVLAYCQLAGGVSGVGGDATVETRRAERAGGVGAGRTSLVVRGRDGVARAIQRTDGSLAMPTFADDPWVLHAVLLRDDGGADLLSYRLVPSGEGVEFGEVISRVRLAVPREGSGEGGGAPASLAYQVLASAGIARPRAEGLDPAPLLFFHPAFARMAALDAERSDVALLAEGSIAAAAAFDAATPGYLLSTPEGLTFQARAYRVASGVRATPRVLADSYVPRATTDPARPFILLGPGRSSQRLEVAAMRFTKRE